MNALNHLRLALRGLSRRRAFAATVVLTVGLGVGVNAAIFSLLNGFLLAPLPFEKPDRLVAVDLVHREMALTGADPGPADFRDLRAACHTCAGVAAWDERYVVLSGPDGAERLRATLASANLFGVLGVSPALGREFLAEDERPGATTAVLGDGLWRRRFGGDPAVLGRTVRLDGHAVTVVGIMPPGFRFPELADLWLPLPDDRDRPAADRFLEGMIVRLGDGVGLSELRGEVDALSRRRAADDPEANEGWAFSVTPLRAAAGNPNTRRYLTIAAATAALVLLVAWGNLVNLLLAREVARDGETRIRLALGSGFPGVLAPRLAESAVLAGLGGAAGLAFAVGTVQLLLAASPEELPYWVDLSPGWPLVGFTAALAAVTAGVLALVPAAGALRRPAAGLLREGPRGGIGAGAGGRLQSALVALQIGLACGLVFASLLAVRSAHSLLRADIGFATDRLLVARLTLSGSRYADPQARAAFVEALAGRLEATSGAAAAALTGAVPSDDGGAELTLHRPGDDPRRGTPVTAIPSSSGLWDALDLPLRAGRGLTAAEAVDPEARVAIVNEALARQAWPAGDALGASFRLGDGPWLTVVGIAPNLVYEELGEETPQSRLQIHLPYASAPWSTLAAIVRAEGTPAELIAPLRAELAAVDPEVPVVEILPMDEVRRLTTWGDRLVAGLMAAFAALALALGGVGLYGTMAFVASRRVREIGVRMTLGAGQGEVIRWMVGRGLRLAAAGLLLGLGAMVAAGHALRGAFWGIDAADPVALLPAPAILLAVALVASWIPARSAARTPPTEALRRD